MGGAPFHLRPGLVAAMLDFYDELRRRQRTRAPLRAIAASIELRVERGTDRGSEGLIHQTCFLGFAFLGYERGVAASGGWDEHVLCAASGRAATARCRSITSSSPSPIIRPIRAGSGRRISICSAGCAGVARLDVVVTDETHDAGFRDRARARAAGHRGGIVARTTPAHAAGARPAGAAARPTVFVSRDREEELRDVARDIRAERRGDRRRAARARSRIVFHRPLPYLYLAQQVLDRRACAVSGVRRAAARRRAVRGAARSRARRSRAPAARARPRSRCCDRTLLQFDVDGTPVGQRDAAALDGVLAERRATGEAVTYPAEVDGVLRVPHDRRDRFERERGGARGEPPRPWSAIACSRSARRDRASAQVERHRGVPARAIATQTAGDAWQRAPSARPRGGARRARRAGGRVSAA